MIVVTTDDLARRKQQTNNLRFIWHEWVLKDAELREHPTALALAGHIMHRFHWEKGYAEFSINSAAKALNMEPRSVVRARQYLVQRGWIRLLEYRTNQKGGWAANRYTLSGGSDDLDLSNHRGTDTSDSGG